MWHERLLRQFLVDRDHRGNESAVGIFEAHQVQHALHRPVFAGNAVERVEHDVGLRSEEHTSELQSLMRISYAVFCLKKKIKQKQSTTYRRRKLAETKTQN